MSCTTINGLAVHERIAGSHRHGGGIVRVHEIEVVNIRRVDGIDVGNPRVHDVDVVDEYSAATESREERFAKTQREPA